MNGWVGNVAHSGPSTGITDVYEATLDKASGESYSKQIPTACWLLHAYVARRLFYSKTQSSAPPVMFILLPNYTKRQGSGYCCERTEMKSGMTGGMVG